MAPVTATTTGVARQIIDNPELTQLLERLSAFDTSNPDVEDVFDDSTLDGNASRLDLEGLVGELERWPRWKFQEMADLYEWIKPLNAMDAGIRQIMKKYPALLLVGPAKKKRDAGSGTAINDDVEMSGEEAEAAPELNAFETVPQAESEAGVEAIPPSAIHALSTILKFLSTLLRHAMNKTLFNSVKELANLLAAADDGIAAMALDALANLVVPPLSHRLQSHEVPAPPHTFALHAMSNSDVHSRLMLLAKGWGTKGCGLDLATCVTTDDSTSGQGALPRFAGEVLFEFLSPELSKPTTVKLSREDMYNEIDSDPESPVRQKEKRRKMSIGSIVINGSSSREIKSTAALFFQCLDQIGGRSKISQKNMFAMLAHIRLATSFHSQSLRTAAVERRLRALIAMLYAHPMQEVLAGYFQAQPELCTEIGDLVRPIVSSTAISATGVARKRASDFEDDCDDEVDRRHAAIASIVEPATTSHVPYNIRIIAVEALTALVARKDDESGTGLSPVARVTNVLIELGVGKGQFLGLLPTLIRYSLASLNVFLSRKKQNTGGNAMVDIQQGVQAESSLDVEELGLDLGLTFLEATRAPTDDSNMESKAIEFVETVLSLANSIISVTTGTASLTDCGLVPALVSTIAQTSHVVNNADDLPFELSDASERDYCSSLLKFITSLSMQILEVAIITHNPALMAFHDLKAVDLLVTLLHSEFEGTKVIDIVNDETMEDEAGVVDVVIKLDGSTRVLLFSILNCLTIVFHHQETNPRSNHSPMSAANVLRRSDMTEVLMTIMTYVHSYGGVLVAVATTLLSDIMNSDPKLVHYVYESGLADAFFKMIKGSQYVEWKERSKSSGILDVTADVWHEPDIPVTAELIMSLPNVISALALTEDGRKRLLHVNPIPELLSLLCTSRFAMPHSRCMLNDMASLIGAGLDELIRHVPNSKHAVIKALVATIERIKHLGQEVVDAESKHNSQNSNHSRLCLMHYASNIGQALEHVLQNEDNCGVFVAAGGVDAILDLHPLLIVRGSELLSHISSQSSPSIANLSHSTAATILISTIKRTAVNDDPCKIMKKIMTALTKQLSVLKKAGATLRQESSSVPLFFNNEDESVGIDNSLNASGILENIPKLSLNLMQSEELDSDLLHKYADYLLEIINTEWLSQVMSEVVRISCHRNSMTDVRSLENSRRLDWQKELATPTFQRILTELGMLYRSSISEVCRVRSSPDYEDLDMQRWKPPGDSPNHPAIYRLRIVCSDGAVVRDGIDIDTCDSVGNLEMGEEVLAFDRCINRSGIMRYRTSWGWVSEQTRGHGREPISEVISVHGVAGSRKRQRKEQLQKRKPIDYGVADLRSAGASILARLQNSHCSLYTSLGRVTMTIPRSRPFSQTQIGPHIGTIVREIGNFLRQNFSLGEEEDTTLGPGGLAMYLGNMLSIFHSSIYEERREKQYLNVLVLCNCLYHDGLHDSFLLPVNKSTISEEIDIQSLLPKSGFYAAVRSVIRYGFAAIKEFQCQGHVQKNQRLNRVIASSLPTALSLLRHLSSQSLLIDSALGDILQKMNSRDFSQFLCEPSDIEQFEEEGRIFSFRQHPFASHVHCSIGAIAHDFWKNKDLMYCPPHVLNSIFSLLREVLICVEDSSKRTGTDGDGDNSLRRRIRNSLADVMMSTAAETDPSPTGSQGAAAPSHSDNSEGKEGEKEPTDARKKKSAEESYDLKLTAVNKECCKSFKQSFIPTAIALIEGLQATSTPELERPSATQTKYLRDDEATSVLVGSFLLEICTRYPSDRSEMLEQILVSFESSIVIGPKGHATVVEGKCVFFTHLCQITVLFLRAIPKSRISVLKRNVVSLVLKCLRPVTHKSFRGSLPSWVTPALLLLEVMAQPMVLPPRGDDACGDDDKKTDPSSSSKRRDDYDRVAADHKKQKTNVSKTAKKISSTFAQRSKSNSKAPEAVMLSNWTDFPAFAPLISIDAANHCLSICLLLLERQKRQKQTSNESNVFHLTPTTTHAIILLLTKILCIQQVRVHCLRDKGVELLLGLHQNSRFKGHVSLLSQAMRLMIEDESTLQTETEIELRSIVAKMLKKNGSGDGVPVKNLVQAAIPLICRDPVVFLRAAATSITVKKEGVDNEVQALVTLLSTEERTRNTKIVQDCRPRQHSSKAVESSSKTPTKTSMKTPTNSSSSVKKRNSAKKESTCEQTPKNKTPHHRQSKKSAKKEKQESSRILIGGSPPYLITNLLLNDAIRFFQEETNTGSDIPFLCVFEYLEILGDLLLVIPTCSIAICNYKIPAALARTKDESRSGLHYLLHSFLSQDRAFPNTNDDHEFELEVEGKQSIDKKRDSFLKIKLAQCTARLLVGLVARIGDGRRRVITELSSALQSGSFHESDMNKSMCALQAWGELCLGLAAPRRTVSSTDDSSLSFEVLKVMSESRMAHSLLSAIKNIRKEHTSPGSTAATLLKPLELLTRPSVIDALQEMFDKEEKKKESSQSDQRASLISKMPKGHHEGSLDEGMLADGFDLDYASSNSVLIEDGFESVSSHESSDSENDLFNSSDSDESESEEGSENSESNSNSEDDSMGEDDDIDEMEVVEDDEEIHSDSDSDSEDGSDGEDADMDFDDDFHIHHEEAQDDFLEEDEEVDDEEASSADEEDGWTNVDSGGLGILFGSRNGAAPVGRPRQGGLMIEAAASVLNNILRSGEIHMDALAEIEQSLGIRLPPMNGGGGGGGDGETPRFRIRTTMQDRSEAPRAFQPERSNRTQREGTMGAMPLIIQNSPPDNGFSSIGNVGRSGETNFMEILYCGPVFGAGGVYYDLLSDSRNEEDMGEQANELLPVPLSLDVQLFPGGPAACTQTRAISPLHPMLAGVGLAPSNSLVSRNQRVDDQMNSRSRSDPFSPGWPDFLIRLHRNPPINPNGRAPSGNGRGGAGTLDSTASEFGRAFETAIADVVSNQQRNVEIRENPGGDPDVHPDQAEDETQNEDRPSEEGDQAPFNALVSAESIATDETAPAEGAVTSNEPAAAEVAVSSNAPASAEGDVAFNEPASMEDIVARNEAAAVEDIIMGDAVEAEAIDSSDQGVGHQRYSNESIDIREGQESTLQDNVDEEAAASASIDDDNNSSAAPQLVCPPGMDHDVFAQLPLEMQQEIVEQHQTTTNLAQELDEASGLDPEALAALPEDMRREVIEQERQLRIQEHEPRADPSRAEDLDPASFIASLAPDLREEILVTSDADFLNSLPPDIQAEAQLLRERDRHRHDMQAAAAANERSREGGRQQHAIDQTGGATARRGQSKKRVKTKIRVDCNRSAVAFSSPHQACDPLITPTSMKSLIDLMFLLSPVRPQKLLQKVFHNLCYNPTIRKTVAISFIALLDDEPAYALDALQSLEGHSLSKKETFSSTLVGTAPATQNIESSNSGQFFRKNRSGSASAIACNLPLSARGSNDTNCLPPVVARRILMVTSILTKAGSRLSFDMLRNFEISNENVNTTCLDTMLGLLSKPLYSMSSSNLDDLLSVIENICAPLGSLPIHLSTDVEPSKKDLDTAAASGKEFVSVPRAVVSPGMLRLLCSILRLESCKDSLFARVSNIARRLCRVEQNRDHILKELASVAHGLGKDSIRDLRSLRIRLNAAVKTHYDQLRAIVQVAGESSVDAEDSAIKSMSGAINGAPSSAVTLSTNTAELKLLRVIQTLHSLCADPSRDHSKKQDVILSASPELVDLLQGIDLKPLWEQLNACLSIVLVLEGVTKLTEEDEKLNGDDDDDDDDGGKPKEGKKLQNSVAGLLTRFLPTIEAFFVVNACHLDATDEEARNANNVEALVGGETLMAFIATNKVLLNALLRSSPSLLDKGLRAMVHIPRCTVFLDFDVKRFWFKQQMRKLRSQASRRHGSLRLTIRRANVFDDAYRQLSLRHADELRGRLHVTFANEEGVDAGGLSREFFGILAKEMFNPNYALFTSTEDGCTFQPNQHSTINPDHLDYFRFVGRIVGKAVADGFLLDAHFTRSLYKHMLGVKPTYHDMQAIDPDYYKNLKMILDYNLEDIGLDLTFSTITHWFGRSQTVDLIPNGRNIPVTDKDKEKYVNLVCQHRMTTAIQKQIQAYLDGFYDLIKPTLISIFTPKELELLISGMPEIDIADLKKNTEYQGYRVADKEIAWFWNIMFSLSKSDKAEFLQFVTGSSKVPLNGFSDLQGMRGTQKFAIHKASGPAGALMSAHTCFNSLDLPSYKSEEEMKEKLLYAIKEGAGSFQFS